MDVVDQPRVALARPQLWRPRALRLDAGVALCTVALGVIAFLVLYPLWLLLLNSFQVGAFGTATTWGLDNWTTAFTQADLRASITNTIGLALTRQALALVIALPVAWLLARTDLPARGWLEFGFWVTVFLPPVTVVVGWILLFDGFNGLANRALETLPFVQKGPFEIFSWWGIVLVHLLGATLGLKIMFLAPAFRNVDAALEEAARASGASVATTLRRVVIPLLAPAVLVITILGLIQSLESFEVELILGAPAGIDVFSTKIYRLAHQNPPVYGSATALSMLILLGIAPLIALQQRFVAHGDYATVSGKHSGRLYQLGRWKWPAFAAIASLVGAMTLLPTLLVVVGSFMKIFGAFQIAQPWTLDNWTRVLARSDFVSSLVNTLILAVSAALISTIALGVVAYIAVRTRFWGRGALDFLTWIPSLLPGIVISLGFLWMFLETPLFRPVYGTTAVLVIAVVLGSMTRSVQMAKASLVQIGAELEQAGWVSGATWWTTLRRVVLPLVAPTMVVVGILAFSSASRTAGHVAMLATASNRPLVLMQLDLLADGAFEAASVVGVVILLLTIGAALLARAYAMRARAGTDR